MASKIVKFIPSIDFNRNDSYKPVLVVVNKKIYRIDNWSDLFKILLFSYCYRVDNMERVNNDINIVNASLAKKFIVSGAEESNHYSKFSPDLYVRVFPITYYDCCALKVIWNYIGNDNLDVYLLKSDAYEDSETIDEIVNNFLEETKLNTRYKLGATKYLIAHINGKVLNEREKFYRRIEKEFDQKVLIGDIAITDKEEKYLKSYMKLALEKVAFNSGAINHPKVFAFGLVRVALKHYSNKTFWPHLNAEYGTNISSNYHSQINAKYKSIMLKNGKLYDVSEDSAIQNIGMHAFVCNKCADQFFNYIFEFWRVDLSRSIDNCIDDDGNDLFEILIDEISRGVQDVMQHTMLALKNNAKGVKNRFRRFLKMVDKSFWYDADYSESKNRMVVLFNEWKNNPNGAYIKEVKKSVSVRKNGRGEKLLSKPTIVFDPRLNSLRLVLPKQLLRDCTEEEYPTWYITIGENEVSLVPQLLRGKAFLFTQECSLELNPSQLFDHYDIQLRSEKNNYYRRTIDVDVLRFFNSQNRNIEIFDDYISRDLSYVLTKKNTAIRYINGTTPGKNDYCDDYDIYSITSNEGDILILPNNHALSIGRPLIEGIIGNSQVKGVVARFDNSDYQITSYPDKIFFKTNKKRINGTSIKIYQNGEQTHFNRIIDCDYIEFKLDERVNDIYGYIIDLNDYFKSNGIYKIELSIPNSSIRTYNICFIEGFDFEYEGAPYIFHETGIITFPAYMNVLVNSDWIQVGNKKTLEFEVDEDSKDGSKYVKNKKLNIKYKLPEKEVELIFDLPVLYWKYASDDRWYVQRPSDRTIKNMPNRIYVSGDLDFGNTKMYINKAEDLDESEISVNYDKEKREYYFRTIDVVGFLNKDKDYRSLYIRIADKKERFFKIACRSSVKSKSITGDFLNNKIMGYFDIFGDSDYVVTVRFENELIEEDIPIVDGRFEISCDVKEGTYNIQVFEIEDDDSGFGSVSYRIGNYQLDITDIRNLSGRYFNVSRIRSNIKYIADLYLSTSYCITDIVAVDYQKLASIGSLYTWKYDPYDDELLSSFVYYTGILSSYSKNGDTTKIRKVYLMFDNMQNANEVIINVFNDGEFEGLTYSPDREELCPKIEKLSKYDRRHLKMLDDDVYCVEIDVRGKK